MLIIIVSIVLAIITVFIAHCFLTDSVEAAPSSLSPSAKKSLPVPDSAPSAALPRPTTPLDSGFTSIHRVSSSSSRPHLDLSRPQTPRPLTPTSPGPLDVPSRPVGSSPGLHPSLLLAPESPPVVHPPTPYTPSHEDVIAVRAALRHLLPLDITDVILHIAEYYPLLISALPAHHLDQPLTVTEGRRLVVLSPPIQRPDSISRVLIQTESHDQGWSRNPPDQGKYRNSWTWLDLGVVRNTSGDIPAPEWRIYSNLRATLDWQAKEVILDTSNETVGALLPGDSLVIWAGARFPAWVNYVRSAKIEVNYKI
jgi:hypothetical protein